MKGPSSAATKASRDLEALQKKFEPKQTELKSQNDELDGLKKQLTTQQDKLNEEALATLKKQIESKQKVFDRAVQDAQEDFGNQHQEIAQAHPAEDGSDDREVFAGQRLRHDHRHLEALAAEQCADGGREAIDITKAVVDTYNAQSGVAAPASSGAKAGRSEANWYREACGAQADRATKQ